MTDRTHEPARPGCPPVEDLSALLDGEVSNAVAGSLRAHLATCESCARALRALEGTSRIIGALGGEAAPDDLIRRVAARARVVASDAPAPRSGSGRARLRRWLAAAAAILGAAILVRIVQEQQSRVPDPRVAAGMAGMAVDETAMAPARRQVAGDAPLPAESESRLADATAMDAPVDGAASAALAASEAPADLRKDKALNQIAPAAPAAPAAASAAERASAAPRQEAAIGGVAGGVIGGVLGGDQEFAEGSVSEREADDADLRPAEKKEAAADAASGGERGAFRDELADGKAINEYAPEPPAADAALSAAAKPAGNAGARTAAPLAAAESQARASDATASGPAPVTATRDRSHPGDQPVAIGPDIVPPVLASRVDPGLPPGAFARLDCVIERDGSVTVLRAIDATDAASARLATRAVAQWRYRPARRGEQPQAVHLEIRCDGPPPAR